MTSDMAKHKFTRILNRNRILLEQKLGVDWLEICDKIGVKFSFQLECSVGLEIRAKWMLKLEGSVEFDWSV